MRAWITMALMGMASLLGAVAGSSDALAAPDKDTLIIALDTLGAQVMDPIADTRAPHAHYQAPIFDSLVGFDYDKGGVGPGVAERWERAADGKSWTFYLRSGLRWHNGDPLTAQDVKFSLERTMLPESRLLGRAALRRTWTVLRSSTAHRAYLYHGRHPDFPAGLSRAVFQEGQLMPKKYIETVGMEGFRKKPIGSGPWKFVRSVPGDRVEYEAVDYPHWRGHAALQASVILLLVPEKSTRLAMVSTGEAAIVSISPESMREARRPSCGWSSGAGHHAGRLSVLGHVPPGV